MKIGIIVYSQTGNTGIVAEKLRDKLKAAGHDVLIDPIVPAGEVRPGPGASPVRFSQKPDAANFEGIIFASPVQGFSLAPAMKGYMRSIGSLSGKTVATLVTKQLAGMWTGGNSALRNLKKGCEVKGAAPAAEEVIFWGKDDRDAQIDAAADRVVSVFAG